MSLKEFGPLRKPLSSKMLGGREKQYGHRQQNSAGQHRSNFGRVNDETVIREKGYDWKLEIIGELISRCETRSCYKKEKSLKRVNINRFKRNCAETFKEQRKPTTWRSGQSFNSENVSTAG